MIIAVYKLDGKILKTINLTKKLEKLKKEPCILYKQEFMGNNKQAELILDNWIKENTSNKLDLENSPIKLYHYRNPITGYTKISIYDNLDVNGYVKIK